MVEIDFLRPRAWAARYVRILASWHVIEVPRGWLTALSVVRTYLSLYLRSDVLY